MRVKRYFAPHVCAVQQVRALILQAGTSSDLLTLVSYNEMCRIAGRRAIPSVLSPCFAADFAHNRAELLPYMRLATAAAAAMAPSHTVKNQPAVSPVIPPSSL